MRNEGRESRIVLLYTRDGSLARDESNTHVALDHERNRAQTLEPASPSLSYCLNIEYPDLARVSDRAASKIIKANNSSEERGDGPFMHNLTSITEGAVIKKALRGIYLEKS